MYCMCMLNLMGKAPRCVNVHACVQWHAGLKNILHSVSAGLIHRFQLSLNQNDRLNNRIYRNGVEGHPIIALVVKSTVQHRQPT